MTLLGTVAPDPTGPPELDIAAMVSLLKANGYTVRKARTAIRTVAAGWTPTRCTHCGADAAHVTGVQIGKGKSKAGREERALCDPCYRFGPHMTGMTLTPKDPERMARLLRVWRRAHHRFARRVATDGYGSTYTRSGPVREAEGLAGRILQQMGQEPMHREYVPTDMFGRLIGGDS